jgi:hypothetical protein
VYICGKARSGKTWLLESIALHLAEHGAGFCFIDPHRDAVEDLVEHMDDRRWPLIVDLARTDRQAGLNPLEVHEEDELPDVVSRTVCAFQAAYGWSDRTHPRTLTLARMATQALVEANLKLADDGKATVFQITTLLTDERFRDAVLSATSPTVERYFRHEFPHYEPAAAAPLLDKISALRADRRTKLLLGQSQSPLDIRQVMDDGECLLVSLAGLGDKSQFVGSLFVYELFRAAKTRADMPADQRRPFYLLCDEVQLYQGPTLAAACGETPKYGLKLILANQFLGHLSKDVRGAILGNYSQLISFTTDQADAVALADEFGDGVDPGLLTALPRFTCMVKPTVERERLSAVQIHTVPPSVYDVLMKCQRSGRRVQQVSNSSEPGTTHQEIDQALADNEAHALVLLPRNGHGPDFDVYGG